MQQSNRGHALLHIDLVKTVCVYHTCEESLHVTSTCAYIRHLNIWIIVCAFVYQELH